MREADAIATEVENLNLRNDAMRVQQQLSSTRQEVSSLEADLSMTQAEARLQASRIPHLRQQVEQARQERSAVESQAAEIAEELLQLQTQKRDENAVRSMGVVGPEAHKNIISRHATRLEESKRLKSVMEMRDTLANSALEAVLVDEIADVEREIREMHSKRTNLGEKLQRLVTERTEMANEIEQKMKELGQVEDSVNSMQRKKEELSALTNIATSPSPAAEPLDSSTSATEEIGLLDNAIEQMQKSIEEKSDPADKEFTSALLSVLQSRREYLFKQLPEGTADVTQNEDSYVKELEQKVNDQNQQLEELRQKVAAQGEQSQS